MSFSSILYTKPLVVAPRISFSSALTDSDVIPPASYVYALGVIICPSTLKVWRSPLPQPTTMQFLVTALIAVTPRAETLILPLK